ncbi:ferredoxin [Actinomadura opuntiae]|uniref:ferredoxin n=1 Tax=Actinomadura sp. OS1-43 TaxID=604315 RepID=UPI00255AA047|nr:ferredoxin [Actinomadura sp. OS1-43]MDL4815419.1 ferredoxin [Actinomadura sp. OS1-43]
MRISVDRDRCIGTGQCVLTAADVFDTDEDGLVLLLLPDPDGAHAQRARRAANRCPTAAISVDDRHGPR